jgi:hypothetical protein
VGSLDTAILKAAELAGIQDYQARNFPRKKSILEILKDTDFLNMQNAILLLNTKWNPAELAEQMLENMEPYSWQYLMPYRVD